MNKIETIHLRADAELCPERIDLYLAEALPDLSRSRIQKLIREGKVRVDGREVKPKHPVEGGEEIELLTLPAVQSMPEPEDIPLEVLYEDEDLSIVNKPAGLVVHPGAGMPSGTLVNALVHRYGVLSGAGGADRPGIVHRLDRLTSGCLAVARNDMAHRSLSLQLAERTMGRLYLAWVIGEAGEAEGRIDAPIGRSRNNPTRMAIIGGGRPAGTNWRVLARAPGLTRLECRLETGRTHQIRVHLTCIGHPVVGDRQYGLAPRDERMRIPPGHPHLIQALARCGRQMLHAWQIRLCHPRTGEEMVVEAPLPDDFRAFDRAAGVD
ncbi:RluA family pseudouridine synthase [bacterium]|nr:RluA family pseudouridine synthase [bacterium]